MGNEGNENDRLVFDYLSRIGDLAQQRQMPAAERRELVTGLRDEIDRRRAVKGEGVPGILGALGTPDEVVGRIAPETTTGRGTPGTTTGRGASRASTGRGAPQASTGRGAPESSAHPPVPRQGPPGRAGTAKNSADGVPGPRAGEWWQHGAADPAAAAFPGSVGGGALGAGAVPGFVGGVEIPELLEPPRPEEEEEEAGRAEGDDGAAAAGRGDGGGEPEPGSDSGGEAPAGRTARLRGLLPGSPLLLVAAVLLLVGAAVGSLVPLAAGWLLAYASRERRAAVLVIPGLAATAGVVWLWGRVEGRWGDPVAGGDTGMGAAVADTWPWALRGAAVASALFLLWRSRRRA
ncbi:hypothetical protein [Streptomyces sp. NPDC053431]|uniref:hypothetical protein n=1 Tax=Streptomyces sp. NPDC053431 TaxID=3365703 RepID=UPI0037D118CB